jgi:HSP20 family protein
MVYRAALTAPLIGFRRDIDKLFDDTFGSTRFDTWAPSVDVKETNDALTFEVDLPGVAKDKVDVTCDNGVLTISGERASERNETDARYHIVERTVGTFRRSFQLPQNLDEAKIEAQYGDGVLTLKIPKAARPVPKKIAIR